MLQPGGAMTLYIPGSLTAAYEENLLFGWGSKGVCLVSIGLLRLDLAE